MVVTATRIEQPLQQVPMSISAVTGADIERRAIDNLTELSRWTPGLTVVDQGARGSNGVIVRGLHTDALNGSEAAGNNYIVRAVDYQVVGAPGQFRLFADDAGDVARWRRVEGAAS